MENWKTILPRMDITFQRVDNLSDSKNLPDYMKVLFFYSIPIIIILFICLGCIVLYVKVLGRKGDTYADKRIIIGVAALCIILCVILLVLMIMELSDFVDIVKTVRGVTEEIKEFDTGLADLQKFACQPTNDSCNLTECQQIKSWKAVTQLTVDQKPDVVALGLIGGSIVLDIIFIVACLAACVMIILLIRKATPRKRKKALLVGLVALVLAFLLVALVVPQLQLNMDLTPDENADLGTARLSANQSFLSNQSVQTRRNAAGKRNPIINLIKLMINFDTEPEQSILEHFLTCEPLGNYSISTICDGVAKSKDMNVTDIPFCKKYKDRYENEYSGICGRTVTALFVNPNEWNEDQKKMGGGVALGVLIFILVIILCVKCKKKPKKDKADHGLHLAALTRRMKEMQQKMAAKKPEEKCPQTCDVCPKKFKKCGLNLNMDCAFHVFRP